MRNVNILLHVWNVINYLTFQMPTVVLGAPAQNQWCRVLFAKVDIRDSVSDLNAKDQQRSSSDLTHLPASH